MYHGAGGSDMSLFSVVEHNDDRYTGALRKMHMPRLLIELMMLIYRFGIYSSSYCVCNYDSTGGKTWK